MEIVRIQNPETLEVIQYWIDGKRVSKQKCNEEMQDMTGYNSSYTTKTRSGNWKHGISLNRDSKEPKISIHDIVKTAKDLNFVITRRDAEDIQKEYSERKEDYADDETWNIIVEDILYSDYSIN